MIAGQDRDLRVKMYGDIFDLFKFLDENRICLYCAPDDQAY